MPKSQNHATKEYFLVLDHDGLPSFYEETLWSQSIHTLFVSIIASTGWYHGDLVDGCGDDFLQEMKQVPPITIIHKYKLIRRA